MQVPIRVVQAAGRAHPMRCEAAPEPTCRANTPFRNIQHETHREQAPLAPIVKRGGTSQAEEEPGSGTGAPAPGGTIGALQPLVQWVGTTSRGPTGGAFPHGTWGNLITNMITN